MGRTFDGWGWQGAQHSFTLEAATKAALPQISAFAYCQSFRAA
jgi:hypothetical protein